MPFIASQGATLYYEVHGAGPAVVFSHGLGGHTLFCYQQVPDFAPRASSYRVFYNVASASQDPAGSPRGSLHRFPARAGHDRGTDLPSHAVEVRKRVWRERLSGVRRHGSSSDSSRAVSASGSIARRTASASRSISAPSHSSSGATLAFFRFCSCIQRARATGNK
jgi:hypothetical protein